MSEKVYIHELIDIIGQNRARYMHHMTANWCPIGRAERDMLCYGVWATVGSTGRWPEVVNMWELPGWDGLAAAGVRGEVYAHELVSLPVGGARRFLDALAEEGRSAVEAEGLRALGAFRVALRNDDEALVLWAVPSFAAWAEFERAWDGAALRRWRDRLIGMDAHVRRTLLVDAPLAPLRTGRQPQVEDRRPLSEI